MSTTVWRCECGTENVIPDSWLGRRVRCNHCGAVSEVVKPSSIQVPPPLTKASADRSPTKDSSGKRPLTSDNSAGASLEEKKIELSLPVIWAAVILGTGTLLLLLSTLAFRGRDTQQQAENSQASSGTGLDLLEELKHEAPAADENARNSTDENQDPAENTKSSMPTGKVMELADLAELVRPSVVQVQMNSGTGSGFVLDREGTIVTNFHVIEDATVGTIVFSDRTTAPIVGYLGVWPEKDIALLKVECSPNLLHPLLLATSTPRQGERVAAFGSPQGLQQTMTDGIVSAIRESEELQTSVRIDTGLDALLIQTNASISPGNSGGPLVNMQGMVVGVNTLYTHGVGGLNFAVAMAELPPLLSTRSKVPSPLPVNNPAKITNSIGMKLVRVPAGTFTMGSKVSPKEVHQRYPGGKEEHYEGETPHQVVLSHAFYMGIHEVTVGQFRRFVEADGYKTEAERDGSGGYGYDSETNIYIQDPKYSWLHPGFEQDDNHPVVNVSWNDAVAFCRWLSRLEGLKYRLPTEAEWEYSCRAGSSHEFTYGNDAEQLVGFGNVADASLRTKFPYILTVRSNDGSIFTTRVGSYRPNQFGLYDMHGNVFEWCSDWYGDYPTSSVVDPVGPATGSHRVMRGGCWDGNAAICRSAGRDGSVPSFLGFSRGFRVALGHDETLNSRNAPSSDDPFADAPPAGSDPFGGPPPTMEDPFRRRNPDGEEGNLKNEQSAKSPSQSTRQSGEKLPTSNNSIGMKLARIPKGTFMMGSPKSEDGRSSEEMQHSVTISQDYYLGVMEVTQGQYEKVIGTNPSYFQNRVNRKNESSMYPVEQVSWEDAVEFCKKLSDLPEEKKAGRVYRLPTEAEWEYACRAGSMTAFSFGESPKLLGDYAWFGGNSNRQTYLVGQKKANAWGLYDMHGNVWEWCSDLYGDYPKRALTDPVGSRDGDIRVNRGGGWEEDAADCRSAIRSYNDPSVRFSVLGFRVALSPSGIPK